MNRHDINTIDTDYVRYAPVMEVAAEARARAYRDMRDDPEGIVGEQIAEIGSERALGGSDSPMHDAQRIWVYYRICNAVRSFASFAPANAEACDEFLAGLPI